MCKISIIVPVYKAESYLHSCVDSILSQTFSDFEVFLVDDGSPDNCGTICEEYAKKDSRVHVIHQENQGQSAARNAALKQAKGTWVCFVDSDDLIHPQMLKLLLDAATKHSAGISMCSMVENTQLPEDFYSLREELSECLAMDEETLCALYDREEYPAWVACAKLIKKELVEHYPFCQGRVYEDNEAVCHWIWEAGTLARIPHGLYFYRTNPQSTTQKAFALKRLDDLWALEQIIRFYDSVGCAGMKQRFSDRYAQAVADSCGGLRYHLNRTDLVRETEKRVKAFAREQNLSFSLQQREEMLDVMHPKLIRLYWPAKGAVQTFREAGLSGILKKIKKNLGKGDGQ